ncbi:MAG: nitronate monooxygenase [Actinobacteria bacterium]|nr:nitronate monooxygenase [Actinomycetota bacterium]MBU1944154.1 nitronate monooxygenase [Actinomycetota bacterium]MBU2687473.1 nitronate monooxygenase [Actinomycetota bacterium]
MGTRVLRTSLCDMLDIEYPILSAGMGPNTLGEQTGAPVDLVVAVSEAGGMGVLGGSGYSIEELRDAIREIKSRTDKPYGVDLLLPKNIAGIEEMAAMGAQELPLSQVIATLPEPYRAWIAQMRSDLDIPEVEIMVRTDTTTMRPQEAVAVCIEEKVPLFCAGLGNPGWMVEEAHANGIKVLAITGNTKNAKRMADSGIDLLVAQGHEAGGHTGRIGTMALIPPCIDAAYPIPVLAAGGIADGRGLAGALAMGCVGVWVGTRFLATTEGGASDTIKENIVKATDEDTIVSTMFTGKTLRAIKSSFHDAWAASGLEALPFPMQIMISSALFQGFMQANIADYIGGFAGQAVGTIHEIKPAGEVVDDMVAQAADILTKKLPDSVKAE